MAKQKRKKTTTKRATGVTPKTLADGTVIYKVWIPGGRNGSKRGIGQTDNFDTAVKMREKAMEMVRDFKPTDRVTLKAASEWIRHDYTINGQDQTLDWFDRHLVPVFAFFSEHIRLNQINRSQVTAFRDKHMRRIKRGEIKSGTLKHHKAALNIVLEEAVRRGAIELNPVKQVKFRFPKTDSKSFEWHERKKLQDYFKLIRAKTPRDADIIELPFATGLRRTEMARIQVKDINFDRLRLLVFGKKRKEPMPLREQSIQILRRLVAGREADDYIIDGKTLKARQSAVGKTFVRARGACGNPEHFSCHPMRHSFAMALRHKGLDIYEVSQWMRHKSIEETAKYFHDDGLHGEVLDDLFAD